MTHSEQLPYRVDRSGDIWVIDVGEGISLVDVEHLMRELTAAEARYRMWVIPQVVNLAPEQVRNLSMFANGLKFRSQVSAVVCPHDLTFGIGRMFESLAEADGRRVRVFRERDEAMSWLRSEREQDAGA